MNNVLKSTKGITLIALVITIIVLLILAGVSIAMLTGENGILTQAQRAKTETENAQAEEENRLNQYEDYINKATGVLTGGEWDETKGVNTPALKENMELVKWDDTSKSFVPDDTNSSYDYNNQQWANAKVTIDGVESYFVWIPRYEYKITYNTPGTPSDGGTIEVKFIPTTQTEADEGYIIHPAFTDDSSNNYENGGWNSELSGIWVGKYEAARSDSEGATQGTATTIKVQPGVTSWRSTIIGDMYTYARAYSPSLNSHMLKNSEWGVVAYLTESKYGRNGTEVTINDNSSYITAGGDIVANVDQSSTGNVTGIYDLSGGAYEYVAAYYNGSSLLSNGGSFASQNGTSTEYATAYTGTSASSAYKPGDATYETSGWHGDIAYCVNSDYPFFMRGGRHDDDSLAGALYFDRGSGSISGDRSFRMCLSVK